MQEHGRTRQTKQREPQVDKGLQRWGVPVRAEEVNIRDLYVPDLDNTPLRRAIRNGMATEWY